jgi:hypothetical protein
MVPVPACCGWKTQEIEKSWKKQKTSDNELKALTLKGETTENCILFL